jgi:hypothetical protein
VAVGGSFPGNPDATTVFPQFMKVDYVRVYQRAIPSGPRLKMKGKSHDIQSGWR